MKSRTSGFTLIEAMVAIALVAILASQAVPSFRTMLVRRSVLSAAQTLVSDVQFARSEALRRSAPVSICSLAAGSTSACSGAPADWANGWIVFVDTANRGTVDAGEQVVRVQQPPANIATIVGSVPINTRPVLTFEANGWGRSIDQSFFVTPTGNVPNNTVRLVCVSIMGRASLRIQGAAGCEL